MPTDYEQICKDNIRRRGEEFDDIGRLISEQLYSDRTHFIYELLQNAEDALGRRKRNNPESESPINVKFLLYKDRLVFRHFGENFNTNDVKGISDVLKGSKSEDKTQIGKFGIGFKSVYAFTSTPEIHSGDEHFIIERYIRPRSADRIPQIADGETVFVFPFNHKDLSKEQAFHLIEEKLKKIGSRVLLFLRNITEIEWKIEDQDEGLYLKDPEKLGQFVQKVTVIGQHGNEDEEEEWLVFKRQIGFVNSSVEGFVEVAFRLIEDKKEGKKTIRRIELSPLVVYFPTKLETRFGFLVHGPYDTTASRSDIEDNIWNRELIIETANLLTETVLPWLREHRLLTTSFLEALPIRPEAFPQDSLFRPIYEKVRDALRYQEFLPTADGKYVAGKRAVLARAEDLVNLINPEQLSFLIKKSQNLEWLTTGITETKKDIHRYLVGWKPKLWETGEEIEPIIVSEVRPEDIIEELSSDFLEKQSITWLLNFYAFFEKRPGLIDKLKNKPVVRLEGGAHVIPFRQDGSPNAYLPPENDTEFPVVSRKISKDEKALEFFKKLELTKPDAVAEVIEHVLPKYTSPNPPRTDEHLRDIEKIVEAFQTDSQEKQKRLKDALKETPFILSRSLVSGDEAYRRPDALYFQDGPLEIYFSENSEVGFVSSCYQESALEIFANLGISSEIRVKCKPLTGSHDYVKLEYQSGYRRGLRGFDPDISVEGLSQALLKPSIEKSQIIWDKICLPYSRCIKGKILRSSRQDFSPNASTYKEEEFVSEEFGELLINSSWLPTEKNGFKKPAEISLEELPDQFERDDKLADFLGMKKTEKVNAADILSEGNPRKKELLERIANASDDELERFEKLVPRTIPPPPAPSFREGLANMSRRQHGNLSSKIENSEGGQDHPVRNPERYQNNLNDAVTDGVEKHTAIPYTVQFSPVRDKPDNNEAREFLYVEYHGQCQIMGTTFPKAAANSEGIPKNYFEACSLLPYSNACYLNDAGNMLCVSADTMAKLNYASFEWLDDIKDKVAEFEDGGGKAQRIGLKIKLAGEECVITWSQRHFMRLVSLYKQA